MPAALRVCGDRCGGRELRIGGRRNLIDERLDARTWYRPPARKELEDDLREQLRSGSTLAEIAAANGVEASALIDALVSQAEERINAAVDAERITAEEAAEKLAEVETRITDKINGG